MSFKLAAIGRRAMEHVIASGMMSDPVGSYIADEYVEEAMQNAQIRRAAAQYGFSARDLKTVFVAAVDRLPNPCILNGGPMLAGSLIFMEPPRIVEFMQTAQGLLASGRSSDRTEGLSVGAEAFAQTIWQTHTLARGEAPFRVDPSRAGLTFEQANKKGCLGLVAVGGTALLLSRLLLV